MARIDLTDVGHAYSRGDDSEDWALKPLSLSFDSGKTYALVGPSGCGKTTMLNIISGLVRPSQGRVSFDGVDVTARPTRHRNIAQVFQFPVIYRSMSVRDNLAFPLECRGWEQPRIDARVGSVAEALGLSHRLDRAARHLSADEKQLISLGRGLVRDDVAAVLMDEPLTVIDPQLKFSLRRKIRELSEQFQPTVIYVTHDQYEAMSFAQEVLVMRHGRIMQQGTPEQLFESPRSTYVGYFVGSPAMNYLDAAWDGSAATVAGVPVTPAWAPPVRAGARFQLGIRPEYVRLAQRSGPNTLPATLHSVRDHGPTRVCHVDIGGQSATVKVPREQPIPSEPLLYLEMPRAKVLPYVEGQLAVVDN
jgi:glycerol transport system ATP-binding protein